MNEGWVSTAEDSAQFHEGFENWNYAIDNWQPVTVPHNWDQYEGYRRLKHGNRHGCSWYRTQFNIESLEFLESDDSRRYFIVFEGVGSYATVFVNGQKVGEHAGGRTSFTLDITDAISLDGDNLLAVKADHPANIKDLPWVCGGCSDEYGFSEGSQPMGIFRPVHLEITNEIRVEPFGIHIWNDTTVSEAAATLHINTEIGNYGPKSPSMHLVHMLLDEDRKEVVRVESDVFLSESKEKSNVGLETPEFGPVNLWSIDDPYLYTLVTLVYDGSQLIDEIETPYGIRTIKWDIAEDGTNQFYLNGKPTFINGTAEYEHNMGMSHAFSDEMVQARVSQIRSAGFNAFRDAHQPHNFRYHHAWDSLGVLWWTQMAAHIWYDTPEFRENFKSLLREWVKERRNSPSIILWGLENESTLPTDFARECTEIIREMDPTSPTQRLVTTCNGGSGTDWDVPQNWTGTYGGNPDLYDEDVERQQLIGEYGAWRTLDKHTEGEFDQKGELSEDRMTLLMEKKVRLAEEAKNQTCGHFQWIFTSHENPGRNQSGEGFRELDRVGPVNYKGLFSPWGEPADVYYMYRAHYAPKDSEPMVYLVSHTWPNRWIEPGLKDGIIVYSNCDEVELFNGDRSLGRKKHPGFGEHFQWDDVDIQTNLLRAVGYVNGAEKAEDMIVMNHLPEAENLKELISGEVSLSNDSLKNYLYRMNCGGPDYRDSNGNLWSADLHLTDDQTWGSLSWTDDFENMPAFYASQRRTFDPILNTKDGDLFRSFRYGMDKLKFYFPVKPGAYEIELHFVEPWYGTGGGLDCTNWRNFDVAVNGETVIDDLDIWSESGHDRVLIKRLSVDVHGDSLVINFPEVKSGQAVISAIAISSEDSSEKGFEASPTVMLMDKEKPQTWVDWVSQVFYQSNETFHCIPPELFGAEWIQRSKETRKVEFKLSREADVFVGVLEGERVPGRVKDFDDTNSFIEIVGDQKMTYRIYKKRFPKGEELSFSSLWFRDKYIIMAQAASGLEPPYDLKPKVPYDEDVVVLETDDLMIEKKFSLGCVTFLENNQTVHWPINTGVADYHAIHFKFSNETGQAITATFNLIAADGTLMQSTDLEFHETPEGKYREITTFTESMINAGTYKVQITGEHLKGLSIRGIRVQ